MKSPTKIPRTLQPAILLALLCAPAALCAQAYTPPPPPLTTGPCVPTKKNPCTPPSSAKPVTPAADSNAFPGDTSNVGTLPPLGPDGQPTGKVLPPPAAADPGDSNAFPGTSSKVPDLPTPDSSSSSSTSGTHANPADDEDDDTPLPAKRPTRKKLPKVEDTDTRESKDLDVCRFYLATGNFVGAYNRAKDATRLYPDDSEAHFVLAESAQKLKNLYEAQTEYQAYLKLDPDGDHAKASESALLDLQKSQQKH